MFSIEFLAQCISLIFAILLPSVSVSLYFYSSNDKENDIRSIEHQQTQKNGSCNLDNAAENPNPRHQTTANCITEPKFSFSKAVKRIGQHVKTSYSNMIVIQWSILWALSMCGFLQVSLQFSLNY